MRNDTETVHDPQTYLSEEPEHLERPEAGEGVEEKRVGVRRVASVENPKHDRLCVYY